MEFSSGNRELKHYNTFTFSILSSMLTCLSNRVLLKGTARRPQYMLWEQPRSYYIFYIILNKRQVGCYSFGCLLNGHQRIRLMEIRPARKSEVSSQSRSKFVTDKSRFVPRQKQVRYRQKWIRLVTRRFVRVYVCVGLRCIRPRLSSVHGSLDIYPLCSLIITSNPPCRARAAWHPLESGPNANLENNNLLMVVS